MVWVGFAFLAAGSDLKAQNTKEYIFFGNRVVAIESRAGEVGAPIPDAPGSNVPQGASVNFRMLDANGLPIPAQWDLENPTYGTLDSIPGMGDGVRKFTGVLPGTTNIRAKVDGGVWKSVSVSVFSAPVPAIVQPVSGQPNRYEAIPQGSSAGQADDTKWAWSLSPSGMGSLSAVNAPNLKQQSYTPPSLNFCTQPVTLTAQTRNSAGAVLGGGSLNVSLAATPSANLPSAQAGFSTTVASGSNVTLVANLPGYNCANPQSWSWSGANVQQVGSAWRFIAPGGIATNTNYNVTALESTSGKSTTFTITVVPAGTATVSVLPNPISIAPYTRIRLTANSSAVSPSFTWSSPMESKLMSTSGPNVCFDAGATNSGSTQVTVSMTSPQGSASGTASIQFSTTGFNQQPAPRLTISPTGQARNLTQGFTLTAQQDDCGPIPEGVTWILESGPGSINSSTGVYTPPTESINDRQTLVFRAIRNGTPVFGTKTYVHSLTGHVLLIDSLISETTAGGAKIPLNVSRSDGNLLTNVNWLFEPAGYPGMSINTQNEFSPPSSLDVSRDFTIRGTTVASPILTGTKVIRVNAPCTPTLQMSASPNLLGPGGTATLIISNSCPGNWSYAWSAITKQGIDQGTLASTTGSAGTNTFQAPANVSTASTRTVRAILKDGLGNTTGFSVEKDIVIQPLITVSVAPTTVTLYKNQAQTFNAALGNLFGQQNEVNWDSVALGSINKTGALQGAYTAPGTIASAQSVTIRARAVADTTRMGEATVNLIPVGIQVNPSSPTSLASGSSHTYTATVTGTSNTGVSWQPASSSHGTFNHLTGVLTANSGLSTAGTITLTAVSNDEGKTDSKTVNLVPAVGVYNIQPAGPTINRGQYQTFTAQTFGLGSTPITWSVSAPDGQYAGIIDANTGNYFANVNPMSTQRTITVTATAGAYSRSMNFTVRPGMDLSMTPTSGGATTQNFSVTVNSHVGVSNVHQVWLIIGNPAGGGNQCKVMRDRVNGKFRLEADNGSNMLELTGASVANTQCRLYAANSVENAPVGNSVTTTFQVEFLNYWGTKGLHVFPWNSGMLLGPGAWISMGTFAPPTPPVTISISPNTQQTLQATQTKVFTASVTTGGVNWSLSSAKGSISATTGSSITYTAPSNIPTPDAVTLTATSTADPTKTASVVIQLSNVPPPPTLISLTPLNGSGANPTFVAVFGGMPSGTNANIRFAVASGPNDLFNVGSCTLDFSGAVQSPLYATLNPHPGFVQWSYTSGGNPTYYMYNSFCNTGGNSITTSLSGSQFTLSMNLWFSTSYPEYKRVYINYGGTLIDMGSWTTQ